VWECQTSSESTVKVSDVCRLVGSISCSLAAFLFWEKGEEMEERMGLYRRGFPWRRG
jgi:hypothetical protein